jgi:hypothetical protein
MNPIILGVSLTRMGLIPKDSTILQHFDFSILIILLPSFGIGGGLLEFDPSRCPFMRNSKASCGYWFCTTLLVYGSAHQTK